MDELDKRMLARKARENSRQTVGFIGPDTPPGHAAALLAIAGSWNSFAFLLERELPKEVA